MKIRDLEIIDLRFPTSRTNDGTDAMHPDPDYSAAYVILKTDGGLEGHGFTFTIGRGNEVCAAAIRAFRRSSSAGRSRTITADSAGVLARAGVATRSCAGSGPEKGVIHLAMAADRQRRVGPARQARAEAGVEAARRHDAASRSSRASTSATSPTR